MNWRVKSGSFYAKNANGLRAAKSICLLSHNCFKTKPLSVAVIGIKPPIVFFVVICSGSALLIVSLQAGGSYHINRIFRTLRF